MAPVTMLMTQSVGKSKRSYDEVDAAIDEMMPRLKSQTTRCSRRYLLMKCP